MRRPALAFAVIVTLAFTLALCVTPVRAQAPRDSITLREYVDVRFEAQEKAVQAALAAADRATAKAETASEKRFEGVNEFRASLSDQSRLLMPRAESEQIVKSLEAKIAALEERVSARDNRGLGMGALAGWIVAGIATVGALLAMLQRRKV